MPGSGKSYWGRRIASVLDYAFIDLDSEIEKSEGADISDIITQKGESYFRDLESRILEKLLSDRKSRCILATGGGTPCFEKNLRLLKSRTFSIYLRVSENLLAGHLKDEYHKRPLFSADDSLLSQIISMKTKREAYYEQADAILEAPLDEGKFKSLIPR